MTAESHADREAVSRSPRDSSRARDVAVSRLVVLGMHRSGTSAMAEALCAAGAWVGEPHQLMPGDEFNQHGYFERLGTAELLDEVLRQLGGTWKQPPLAALTRLQLEPFRPLLTKIVSDVVAATPAGKIPLVKDPRLTLFASELPSVLGGTEGIVICVRHPLAVARSLRARDGIPLAIGLALWEAYNVVLCRGLTGRPVRVRLFDGDTERRLPLRDFADQILRSETQSARALEAGLIHQHADNDDELQWLSANQLHLWQALVEAGRAPQPTLLTSVELSVVAERELANAHRHQSIAVEDNRFFAGPGESGLEASVERSLALAAMDDRALENMPDEPASTWQQEVAALRQALEVTQQALDEERVLRAQSEDQRQVLVVECESAAQDRDRLTLLQTELAVATQRLREAEDPAHRVPTDVEARQKRELGEVRALADAQVAEAVSRTAVLEDDAAAQRRYLEEAHATVETLQRDLEAVRKELEAQHEAGGGLQEMARHFEQQAAALHEAQAAADNERVASSALTADLEAAMELLVELDGARQEADGFVAELWSELEDVIAQRDALARSGAELVQGQAASWRREAMLLHELDHFRGLHEETVTAYGTATATSQPPSRAELRSWLDAVAVPRSPSMAAEPDESLADLLCLALVELDALKGYRMELESAWADAHPNLPVPGIAVVADWYRRRSLRADASSESDARVAELRREMMELREHRDAVVTDLLAITSSESWRLGHTLTWPARVLRGGRRKSAPEAEG